MLIEGYLILLLFVYQLTLYWDDLAKMNKTSIFKDFKSLILGSNAKLAQSGRHQSRTQEVPGSILSRGLFLLKYFCYLSSNHFLPTYGKIRLPTSCNSEIIGLSQKIFWFCKKIFISHIHKGLITNRYEKCTVVLPFLRILLFYLSCNDVLS